MPNGTPLQQQKPPYRLLLKHHLAPGDVLVMTAAVECLKRQYRDRYRITVDTTCKEIWQNNPHIESMDRASCHVIECQYPLIHQSGSRPVHFMQGFVENLGQQLGIPLVLDTNHPSLYLSDAEKQPFAELPSRYIVLNAGYKTDFTAKFAGTMVFRQIVDAFPDITFVQVGEANKSHIHKPIEAANVVNWIGKTTTRKLIRLAFHSMAGVGPVSLLHHIYGALQKPYVCYLGGREDLAWENYPTAVMLGTVGQMKCCQVKGCWKSRTVALGDGQDRALCELPVVNAEGETVPGCMEMIGSRPAIDAIQRIRALHTSSTP